MKISTINFNIRVFAFLLFGLGFWEYAGAQDGDTLAARAIFDLALQCKETQHWDSAAIYLEIAMDGFGKAEAWEGWVDAVNELAHAKHYVGEASENKDLLDSALVVGRDCWGERSARVADSYLAMAFRYWVPLKNTDSVEYYFHKGKDIRTELHGNIHTKIADAWEAIGSYYRGQYILGKELPAYQKELEIRLELNESGLGLGSAYFGIGFAHMHRQKFELAKEYFIKASAVFHSTAGRENDNVAECFYYLSVCSDNEETMHYITKAIGIWKRLHGEFHPTVARGYMKIGVEYSNLENSRMALQYYQKAVGIFEKLYGETHSKTGEAYLNIGAVLCRLGEYEKSIDALQKALHITKRTLGDNHLNISFCYYHIARTYFDMGDLKWALENYQHARAISVYVLETDNHPAVIMNDFGIALVLSEMGRNDSALAILQKVTRQHIETSGYQNLTVSYCMSAIADIFSKIGDQKIAIDYYQKSLAINRTLFDADHASSANTYIKYAQLMTAYGKPERAMECVQKAISCSVKDYDEGDYGKNPLLSGINSKLTLLIALYYKARIITMFDDKDNDIDVHTAFETYCLASNLIDTMRVQFSNGAKKHLAGKFRNVFQGGIGLAQQIFRSNKDTFYLHEGFQLAEKSKSTMLLESIKEGQAKHYAGVPDSLREAESIIISFLAYYERKLSEEQCKPKPDSTTIDRYRNNVWEYKQKRDSLLSVLRNQYPQYHQLKYDLNVASIPEVQAYLPDDETAFLEYFYGDSVIFAFAITKDTFALHSIPKDSAFDTTFITLQKQFESSAMVQDSSGKSMTAFQEFTQSSHALYQKLLAPTLSSLPTKPKHLIIVPDGPLGNLPFEVLLTKPSPAGDSAHYDDLPYLIQEYRTSYAWSATVLLDEFLHPELKRKAKPYQHNLLAIAPAYSKVRSNINTNDSTFSSALDSLNYRITMRGVTRRGSIGPLAYNIPEAQSLWEWYGGILLIDTAATEQRFREEVEQARIIHIGAHGLPNADHPEYTNIALQPSTSDSSALDGRLYISELYNMHINAELVVLPVCNSASGENQRGEGIQSLARAFRYAGCPNVIASQWEVDDKAAMDVSLNFYEFLETGLGMGEALRQAKLKQLREGGTDKAHPFYWAPMVLIGEDVPVVLERVPEEDSLGVWVLVGVGIVGFGVLGWLVLRRFRFRLNRS